MRRVVVLLCLAAVAILPGPGRASCAAPSVGAMPGTRRAGELVLITGEAWVAGCDDTGGTECGGCGGCPEEPEEQEMERVVVELTRRGSEPITLHTADVSEVASFAEEVRLPRDLEPGRYRITARAVPTGDRARPARLVIVR